MNWRPSSHGWISSIGSAGNTARTVRSILAYLDKAQKELDDIEFADDRVEQLKKQLAKKEKAAWDAALALRKDRQQKAEEMSQKILTELSQLDMPRVQFACRFRETELTENGADAVAFYMSANVGEDLKPMQQGCLRRRAGPDHAVYEERAGGKGPGGYPDF